MPYNIYSLQGTAMSLFFILLKLWGGPTYSCMLPMKATHSGNFVVVFHSRGAHRKDSVIL